jgi:hypothetical protein
MNVGSVSNISGIRRGQVFCLCGSLPSSDWCRARYHLWFEAVRCALSSLSTELPGSPVEACDRFGQVARFGRGRGYSDA